MYSASFKMATNILDQELCTSNVVSLSAEPNSGSFQDCNTDLVSEITAGDSYDLENICPNTNADKNAVVSESVCGCLDHYLIFLLLNTPLFTSIWWKIRKQCRIIVQLVHIAIKKWDIACLKKIM